MLEDLMQYDVIVKSREKKRFCVICIFFFFNGHNWNTKKVELLGINGDPHLPNVINLQYA